jgi:hypothetical protein
VRHEKKTGRPPVCRGYSTMSIATLRHPSEPDKALVDAAAADVAWRAYCAAAERAQRTRRIEDGIAPGRAWAAFLALFEGQPPPPSSPSPPSPPPSSSSIPPRSRTRGSRWRSPCWRRSTSST